VTLFFFDAPIPKLGMKPYWVAPNLGIVQSKSLRYVLEKREGGESFEVSVDEANCFAPLGWVCNGLIDEKNFWGRVAGCHSETVSTAQNPLAASYQKSEKMKRFWIENWQRKHVVTQKKQREITDLVCVFV
jgi:hypothetical protein